MINDALTTFFTPANANAQPTVVGTTTSDIIDLGPLYGLYRDVGVGKRMKLRAQIETAFTSGGAATLSLSYGDSPDAAAAAYTPRYVMPAPVVVANLGQGVVLIDIDLPDNFQRYLAMQATVAGAAFTGGAIRGAIVYDSDTPPPANAYASAIPSTGF